MNWSILVFNYGTWWFGTLLNIKKCMWVKNVRYKDFWIWSMLSVEMNLGVNENFSIVGFRQVVNWSIEPMLTWILVLILITLNFIVI